MGIIPVTCAEIDSAYQRAKHGSASPKDWKLLVDAGLAECEVYRDRQMNEKAVVHGDTITFSAVDGGNPNSYVCLRA